MGHPVARVSVPFAASQVLTACRNNQMQFHNEMTVHYDYSDKTTTQLFVDAVWLDCIGLSGLARDVMSFAILKATVNTYSKTPSKA